MTNLAESSNEGCGSKRPVLSMMVMMIMFKIFLSLLLVILRRGRYRINVADVFCLLRRLNGFTTVFIGPLLFFSLYKPRFDGNRLNTTPHRMGTNNHVIKPHVFVFRVVSQESNTCFIVRNAFQTFQ
jgi:hypothetical protein